MEAKEKCKVVDVIRIRRVTGYLGFVDSFNDGKFAEMRDRTSNEAVSLGFQRDKVLVRA